jgi:large subunit ribosomal protein L4
VVIERDDEQSLLAVRNLPTVHVLSQDQLNAYDVLVSDDIVFTKAAFDAFVAAKSKKEEVTA